jgi:hypothetical protein
MDQRTDKKGTSGEVISEALMDKFEKQEKRIIAILGTKNPIDGDLRPCRVDQAKGIHHPQKT